MTVATDFLELQRREGAEIVALDNGAAPDSGVSAPSEGGGGAVGADAADRSRLPRHRGQDLRALRYDSVAKEVAAARSGVALAWRPWRAAVAIAGDDRVSFLQRLLSNDVSRLQPGGGAEALLLDQKGRILSDLDLWCEAQQLIVATDTVAVEDVLAALRRYILRSSVTIDGRADEVTILALLGPGVANSIAVEAVVGPQPLGDYSHKRVEIAGHDVLVAHSRRLGAPGVELLVPAPGAAAVWSAFRSVLPECQPLGHEAAEVLRIDAGIAAHGRELTGSEFPQEACRDSAVDYDKGCYVGQETVARIHYRGHVNRLLARLSFAASVSRGARLLFEGSDVGIVTSTTAWPEDGSAGLGYVRRQQLIAGARLQATAVEQAPPDAGASVEVTVIGPAVELARSAVDAAGSTAGTGAES